MNEKSKKNTRKTGAGAGGEPDCPCSASCEWYQSFTF